MSKYFMFIAGMCAASALQAAHEGNAWQALWLAFTCGANLWFASDK